MENVVVGLEDDAAGDTAVGWVIERARSKPLRIRLVTALGWSGTDPQAPHETLAAAALRIQDAVPQSTVETVLADGPRLQELIEQSSDADLLVIGSRPDAGIRESRTESFPVSLAARSHCVVVVVPKDWEPRDGAVVVGIDDAGASDEAALFAAREAVEADRELVMVHTWEPWAAADTRAAQIEHEGVLDATIDRIREAFPAVRARGVLTEAVAHGGVLANSRDAHLVVLGTYRIGRESGVVLGTIHQEVMIRGGVALCIVPLVDAVG